MTSIDLTTPNHPTICTVTCPHCGLIVKANSLKLANDWMDAHHTCDEMIHAAVQHAFRDKLKDKDNEQ